MTRDYAAEMRVLIDSEGDSLDPAPIVAERIVEKLRADDPELLAGWLDAGAVQFVLGVTEPTGVSQRFVHTFRGSGIQYEEYVTDAEIRFTVTTDYDFTEEQWAMLWLTGQQQGIGATRSMGFGRYEVIKWDRIS